MNIARELDNGSLTLSGTLDIMTANSLREALLDGLSRNMEVNVDLAGIERCDTAGLQVLLAAGQTARTLGKSLHLHAISAPVAEVAAALGFSIDGSAESTVEAVSDGK